MSRTDVAKLNVAEADGYGNVILSSQSKEKRGRMGLPRCSTSLNRPHKKPDQQG
jgi:hypothetical protein